MGTRLHVGNLNFGTTAALRELFAADGRTVSEVKIVTDRDTGHPPGFAFVEMGSPADTQAAMSALQGREVGGRTLKVNEAREGGRGGGGGRW
ncbi:MAG: RNA-binding protein [Deltaproteobacteria bacterium]|nr:RNA-binding protein [Deltaproteobacteria bacterium]